MEGFECDGAGGFDGDGDVHEVDAAAGSADLCVGLAAGGPLEAAEGEGGDVAVPFVVVSEPCFFLLVGEVRWEVGVGPYADAVVDETA